MSSCITQQNLSKLISDRHVFLILLGSVSEFERLIGV